MDLAHAVAVIVARPLARAGAMVDRGVGMAVFGQMLIRPPFIGVNHRPRPDGGRDDPFQFWTVRVATDRAGHRRAVGFP